MRTVALDLGVREIVYCEVANGEVIARATGPSLAALSRYLGAGTEPAIVAFEACREAWHVHDRLAEWGHKPVMIDTTRARRIGVGQHGRKNDRLDAEALAFALAREGVPLAHVLSPARRQLRADLSVRAALVATRSQHVTIVRGLARSVGVLIRSCEPESFVSHARAASLPERIRATIDPILTLLEALEAQLADADLRLEQLARTEPVIALLATVPGVGLIVASTFVSALDEAGRFRDGHSVASYLGLVPCEDTTGMAGRRLGAITKQGNPWARVALVQAAHTILRTAPDDDPLRLWTESLVAVAANRSPSSRWPGASRACSGRCGATTARTPPSASRRAALRACSTTPPRRRRGPRGAKRRRPTKEVRQPN